MTEAVTLMTADQAEALRKRLSPDYVEAAIATGKYRIVEQPEEGMMKNGN
jgi:hypothetical protein